MKTITYVFAMMGGTWATLTVVGAFFKAVGIG